MTVLLAVGAALRFVLLGARSLWFDEASTLLLARLPLARLPAMLIRNEMNLPLYAALMHFWLKAFADPRLGLRLFSALCGAATLFAFRSLVERALPPRARLLALFLAAFSSYWLHAAQDGRVYACLLLAAVLCARAVWTLTEAPSPRRWAAYALFAALALHLHYYFVFPLAAHAAWLLARFRRSPRELRSWAAAHAAVALIFLPWVGHLLVQLRLHVHDASLGDPLTARHLADTFGTMFFDVTYLGLALPGWLVPALGAGFGALAAAAAARAAAPKTDAGERRALAFALAHLALPLALIALAELAVGRPITQARYFFPLSPYAFLLAALTLSAPGLWARVPRLALEAVSVAGVIGYFASGKLVDPRFGALADSLRRGTDRRAPIVYLETYYYLPMRVYYLPERVQDLVAEANEGMDYAAVPPYDGVIGRARLASLGPCVVMDEKRLLGGPPLWLGDGAQVAERMAASGFKGPASR